jgi:hypothetical protein
MEPLWSPVVATGCNRLQIARGGNRRKQAKTVGADEFEGAFAAVRASPVWSSRRGILFQTRPFGEPSV